MDYKQTIDYLFNQLPVFQNKDPAHTSLDSTL